MLHGLKETFDSTKQRHAIEQSRAEGGAGIHIWIFPMYAYLLYIAA